MAILIARSQLSLCLLFSLQNFFLLSPKPTQASPKSCLPPPGVGSSSVTPTCCEIELEAQDYKTGKLRSDSQTNNIAMAPGAISPEPAVPSSERASLSVCSTSLVIWYILSASQKHTSEAFTNIMNSQLQLVSMILFAFTSMVPESCSTTSTRK